MKSKGRNGKLSVVERKQAGHGCPGGDAHSLDGTEFELVIVGGGFSGICTAWHLFSHERLRPSFRCAIIEPGTQLGAGLAYRTDSPCHLLNVRARGMSLTSGDPTSLIHWLAEVAPEYSADDFIPRGLYRQYSTSCLDRVLLSRQAGSLNVLRDEVCAVVPLPGSQGYLLHLKSGDTIRARAVVLAIGNLPAKSKMDNGLLCSPWCHALDYQTIQTLAIIGTGLTALDVILEAEEAGYTGRYLLISPHGQFPQPHHQSALPVSTDYRVNGQRHWQHPDRNFGGFCGLSSRNGKRGFTGSPWWIRFAGWRLIIWRGFDPEDKRLFLCRLPHLLEHSSSPLVYEKYSVYGNASYSGIQVGWSNSIPGSSLLKKEDGRSASAVRLVLQSGKDATLDVDAAVKWNRAFFQYPANRFAVGCPTPGCGAGKTGRLPSKLQGYWCGTVALGRW